MSCLLGPKNQKLEGLPINSILESDYDRENDILYLRFQSTKSSFGEEVVNGIVILRDLFSDEITGLTIFYPKSREQQRTSELKALGYPIHLSSFIY